ncbi:hypothetical protein IJG04_02050 [Candidatus Saccharibacteria bacterium]|nr:hypothetical protein [Candidatus Saccharibacteria bacterium]
MDITTLPNWELWVLLIVGVLLLFCGYRIKKIAFFIIWFLLGYTIMMYLMPMLNTYFPEIAESSLWQMLLPIAGGLLLALMGFSIEKLCVGGICFGVTVAMVVNYFGTDIQFLVLAGILGVFAAGIGVTMMKPATVIATSGAGAYAITLAVLALFASIDESVWYWPIMGGLTVIGSLVQFKTTKRLS